jgi:O-methyltransferase involved in polyketide biosynthesis
MTLNHILEVIESDSQGTKSPCYQVNYIRLDIPSSAMTTSDHRDIMSTMIGPLYARAFYGKKYPDILVDPSAEAVLGKVRERHPEAEADFLKLEQAVNEFLGLTLLVRGRILDGSVRNYVSVMPDATVVNLGCGLDDSFSRVDNGTMRWYNLDLPDAITYRLSLLPEKPRGNHIASSVFDTNWFKQVDYSEEQGVFFIAGGLFGYFEENDVSTLAATMAEHFPGGELIFDCQSGLGNRIVNRRVLKGGNSGAEFKMSVGDPKKQLASWSDRLNIVDWFPYFSRISWSTKWSRKTRLMMRVTDALGAGKFIHVRFKS